jgi:diguanylate cyclase (GGDEF)-like protein
MLGSKQTTWHTRLPILLGIVLFAVVGWMTELLIQTQKQTAALSQNIEVHSDLYAVRQQLSQSLVNLLSFSVGVTAYVEAKSGQIEADEVAKLLESLYRRGNSIRNFGLAEGTTLRYLYPEAGNETAIGMDYKLIPQQWPNVLVAMNSPDGVLTGPVELMQGGSALIYRKPIEVENQYWGLFSIVVETDSFLAEIGSQRLLTQGSLAVVAVHGDRETLLYGDKAALSHPSRHSVDVAVPGGHWHLVLVPRTAQNSTAMFWRILGWGIALLLGGGVGTILAQRSALQGLALIDELTGVANRRQFDLMLERFCEKYERRDSGSFALLYVDLDRFKEVNDTHGHRAGDYFLVEIAKRIGQATRGGDLLARWGGDEFALLLDNPSQASIDRVVQRVRELAEQPVAWRDNQMQVGASIGVVRYPEDGTTPEALLGVADQRMYGDKNKRREQT